VGGGWLTDSQFLDGLALSGVLPAPLIIFGTFMGAYAGGFAGAVAITVGIFLPAFAFSLVLGDRIESVVERPLLRNALDGVAAAVVGLIVATALELANTLAGRVPSIPAAALIFLASLAVLVVWRSRLSPVAAIALAALGGWLALGGLP
jgi:chromate transporter